VETERTYVATLETLVDVFLLPLRQWVLEDAQRDGCVNPTELAVAFGNVETLLHVHRELLAGFISAAPQGPAALAKVLAKAAAGPLRMYAPHVQQFQESELMVRTLLQRSLFAAIVRILELQPRSKGLTIQALLASTVQRLPRYILLLNEMLKHLKARQPKAPDQVPNCTTPRRQIDALLDQFIKVEYEAAEAIDAIEDALGKTKAVTLGVDRRVGDAEQRARAVSVINEVLKLPELVLPSRFLLREGTLFKLRKSYWTNSSDRGLYRSTRHVFLFNDMLALHADGRTRVLYLSGITIISSEFVHR